MTILTKINSLFRRLYRGVRRRMALRPSNIAYHLDPWFIQTSKKIKMIEKSLAKGKKVAITLYHTPDATFRYRGYNVSKASEKSKKWYNAYFFYTELNFAEYWLPKASLLIISRMEYEPALKRLIEIAHQNHVPVLYDIDDRICHTDYLRTAIEVTTPPKEDVKALTKLAKNYQKLAELADGFIVTNDFLGRELKKTFKKPFQVIPNSINAEQIRISKCFLRKKKFVDGRNFTVGYFSGTASHNQDFKVAAPSLIRFMKKYPDTKLHIVGKLDLPADFEEFTKAGRIITSPVTDYLHLEGLMAAVDVNIAPLTHNVFNNCKSELKFFESAIVETPTIASPVYAFSEAIKNCETGFICHKATDWYTHLAKLRDPKLRQRIGRSAREYCLKRYSPEGILPEIESAYDYYLRTNQWQA